MEIEGVTEQFEEFKDNAVQDILKESVDVEISQSSESSESIQSRLLSPFLNNLSELTDDLILTSAASVNPHILETFNISCIVSCAPELPYTPLQDDVIYHRINIIDSGNSRILPFFDETADLIHEVCSAGKKTLVYCVAGVSRSATICIAYLMKHHQLPLLEAYNFVKLRRPRIKPNCGFFKQLIEYEKQLFGSNTVHMVFNECVQMEIPDVYDNEYRIITNCSKKRCSSGRH
ncbi:dual specificity protein phosphatase 18-like [Anoplophora glabripennis]|uniref:dual specificity protein phosphatase 18-like n=1 Tax=Anoplophora glabripennis TaxID=217634 RepID=UPI00087576B7|nr:dual specificity protein phosphatase 18-like [Anoplophora glabripennis]